VSPTNGVSSIGNNTFLELINSFGDNTMGDLSLSDIDLEFIATKSGQKGSALNPERALVRYQLMEVLCRIGIQKYYHSKRVISDTS
jgi:hypothetical protein